MGLGDDYSVQTKTAVKSYQSVHGLKADGIAGPETLTYLCHTLPVVKPGDYSGSVYVKAVQALVSATIDGKYGSKTRANVVAFQNVSGLQGNGVVALDDWLALFDCSYTRTVKTSGTNTKQPVDYKQYDSKWKSKPYTASGNSSQTIGSSGCGPTSMADIMATWKDKNITPVEMCSYSLKHGYRTASNGTAWDFFGSVAKTYGFKKFVQTKSMATVKAALKEGVFAVASMGPGYWTKGGHFICLWKCDDTYMYANDPASSVRKKQKLGAFEEQRKQFFIFYK